eukprot:5498881-Pyramimonas_sp.AAC.1
MMLYIDVDCTLTFDKPKTVHRWDYTRIFLAARQAQHQTWAQQLRDDIETDLANHLSEFGLRDMADWAERHTMED